MRNSKRILGDVITNWLRYLVAAVVSFILIPKMTGTFGSERFGLWTLANSTLGFLLLLDGGFGTGVVKWTAEARTKEDHEKRNELLSTALLVHYSAAGIGFVALLGLSILYGPLFGLDGELLSQGRFVLVLLGFRGVVVGIPGGFFRGMIFGGGKLLYVNLVQIASSLVYGFLAIWFLDSGIGLPGLAAIGLSVALVENLAYVLVARRTLPDIHLSLRLASKARFKEAFSFSGASFAVSIAGVILMQSDIIVLKLFSPLAAVARYGVAQKASEYAFMLVKQVVNALTPPIARHDPACEPEKTRFFLVNSPKYAGAFAAIFAVALGVLGKPALSAWAGAEYGQSSIILTILMAAFVILAVQMPCAAVLSLKGQHAFAARAMIASTLINITSSIILVVLIGPLGVAMGTLLATASVDGFAIPFRAYRSYKIDVSRLFSQVWIPILVPALFQGLATWGLSVLIKPESLADVFLAGAGGASVFLVAFWIFSLDSSERELFTVFFKKRNRKS